MKQFSFLQPATLQSRNTWFILLPTFIVLVAMSFVSILLIRSVLLDQWEQTAIAKMQKLAYQVDLRLLRPKRLLMLYQEQSGENYNRHVSSYILNRLRSLDGVLEVNLEWDDEQVPNQKSPRSYRRFKRMKPLEVTPPVYDGEFKGSTISLISEFRDEEDNKVGFIEVKVSFYDLVKEIVQSPWWKSNKAFLVDSNGRVLTHKELFADPEAQGGNVLFGSGSELERKTLEEMKLHTAGTVFDDDFPPEEVSGYYRLREAPWTIVIIASGELVLAPILKFRNYYFLTALIGTVLALLLIRTTTAKTARSIRKVTEAASKLAKGEFSEPLPVIGKDEVSELTRNFNVMTSQLQERMRLQKAMSIAREVQQKLLPQSSYRVAGIDISGVSHYCDETGGDYFDILPDKEDIYKVDVVLGDVVGHGIGAALLMASIRAMVRCRTALPGSPTEIINDVNVMLCRDTEQSGNFVTLFLMVLNRQNHTVSWVRCGHEPAIVYDVGRGEFEELRGDGLVLGFDSEWQYQENSLDISGRELIILIGTDGIWETANEAGEQFGRDRVGKLIAENHEKSSQEIGSKITDAVTLFRGSREQEDDITLVVVKTGDFVDGEYEKGDERGCS